MGYGLSKSRSNKFENGQQLPMKKGEEKELVLKVKNNLTSTSINCMESN